MNPFLAGPTEFRSVFVDAPVAMALVGIGRDNAGRYLAVNTMFCEQLQRTEAELLTLTVGEVTHPDDIAATHAAMIAFAQNADDRYAITKRHVRADGSSLWVEATATLVRDEDGTVRYAVAHVVDIDERMKATELVRERDLEVARLGALESQHRLELELQHARRMESLGRIAAGVAHDFNNLLGVIFNFLAVVRTQVADNGPVLEDLDHIRTAAESAANITRRLMLFGRQDETPSAEIDVNAAIHEVVVLLRAAADHCTIVENPEPLGAMVVIERGEFEQVLLNLLMNALDVTSPGGCVAIATRVVSEGALNSVEISVIDSGRGMSAEDQQLAFEPFYTTKPPSEGTGLGLSTVAGIVQRAKGTVAIESELGGGTTVVVKLPLAGDIARPQALKAAG